MTAELWILCSLIGLGLAIGALIAVGWAADRLATARTRTALKGKPMPELLPIALLAVLLAVAVRCLVLAANTSRRPVPPPPAPERTAAQVPSAACHNIRCGAHNQTPHRATALGLVCVGCGQLADPAQ
ncbi:hypothetical protein [Streptomyces cyaneofuscatus]|uniref:hypothetical protein n=1 Tax=Streptomyces cyaneofuscatus TaxID=66883 RepID=UPI0037A9248F